MKSDAAKKIEELFGVRIEQPAESTNDHIREAQSVINWFETGGQGFTTKQCKNCHEIFAYAWNITGVAYCSITCMKRALQKIGLDWNPSKPPEERWGRTVPAVVPPGALSILQDLVDTQEDLHDNTSSE